MMVVESQYGFKKELGLTMVVQALNPSSQETEAVQSL